MRDPKRIEVILQEISNIWHKNPDMRLGQLIGNVLEGPSLYYVEDDSLVAALQDMYDGKHEPVNFDNEAYIFDLVKKHPDELGFVLQEKDYAAYIASFETVSEQPEKDAILTEDEFNALKKFFTSLEKSKETVEEKEEEHHENYETGYFLEDKPGHSVVRGSFESVEKAKKYAAEHNMPWWRVVGYNYTTNNWDILAQSEQGE